MTRMVRLTFYHVSHCMLLYISVVWYQLSLIKARTLLTRHYDGYGPNQPCVCILWRGWMSCLVPTVRYFSEAVLWTVKVPLLQACIVVIRMLYLITPQSEYIELSNLQFPSRRMSSIETYWVLGQWSQWSQEFLGFPSSIWSPMTYFSGLTFGGDTSFNYDSLVIQDFRDEGFFVSIKTLVM